MGPAVPEIDFILNGITMSVDQVENTIREAMSSLAVQGLSLNIVAVPKAIIDSPVAQLNDLIDSNLHPEVRILSEGGLPEQMRYWSDIDPPRSKGVVMKKSIFLFACLVMFASCVFAQAQPTNKRTEVVFRNLTAQDKQLIAQNKSLDAWVKGYAKKSTQMGGGGLADIKAAYFDTRTLLLSAPFLGPGFDANIVVGLAPVYHVLADGEGTYNHKYFLEYIRGSDGQDIVAFRETEDESSNKLLTVFSCRKNISQTMICSDALTR